MAFVAIAMKSTNKQAIKKQAKFALKSDILEKLGNMLSKKANHVNLVRLFKYLGGSKLEHKIGL